MKIEQIISLLEFKAPGFLQEGYDNAGLLTGKREWECTGAITCLDTTEEVILEAVKHGCNLVVAHHPIIFGGLKKINGKNYVEKAVIAAIKNDVAIYAVHTNLDNVITGVNAAIADKLGLVKRQVLLPKENILRKLVVYVPDEAAEKVRQAIFEAGGGHIGNYSECSFNSPGKGTFKAEEGADPHVGEIGKRHTEDELRVEVVFPYWLQENIINRMIEAHPYEEVAYDITGMHNSHLATGSGLIGELDALGEDEFLKLVKRQFNVKVLRHTALLDKPIKKVAICGGAGSFLIRQAIAAGADVFITSDIKYHEFFDADGRTVIMDIGHYESEQFTIDLLHDIIHQKFPTFAIRKTEVNTNPVRYFTE